MYDFGELALTDDVIIGKVKTRMHLCSFIHLQQVFQWNFVLENTPFSFLFFPFPFSFFPSFSDIFRRDLYMEKKCMTFIFMVLWPMLLLPLRLMAVFVILPPREENLCLLYWKGTPIKWSESRKVMKLRGEGQERVNLRLITVGY